MKPLKRTSSSAAAAAAAAQSPHGEGSKGTPSHLPLGQRRSLVCSITYSLSVPAISTPLQFSTPISHRPREGGREGKPLLLLRVRALRVGDVLSSPPTIN